MLKDLIRGLVLKKVGHVGFFRIVIGAEGKSQRSNLVSRRCSYADTKKGKTGNDVIPEPEVNWGPEVKNHLSNGNDVIPEPKVKKSPCQPEMEKNIC